MELVSLLPLVLYQYQIIITFLYEIGMWCFISLNDYFQLLTVGWVYWVTIGSWHTLVITCFSFNNNNLVLFTIKSLFLKMYSCEDCIIIIDMHILIISVLSFFQSTQRGEGYEPLNFTLSMLKLKCNYQCIFYFHLYDYECSFCAHIGNFHFYWSNYISYFNKYPVPIEPLVLIKSFVYTFLGIGKFMYILLYACMLVLYRK